MDYQDVALASYLLIVLALNSIAAGFFFLNPIRRIKEKRASISYFTAYFFFFSFAFLFFGLGYVFPNALTKGINHLCFILAFYCLLFGFKHRGSNGVTPKHLYESPMFYLNAIVLLSVSVGYFFLVYDAYLIRSAILVANCSVIIAFTFKYIPLDKSAYTFGEKVASVSLFLSLTCALTFLVVLDKTNQPFIYMSSLAVAQSLVTLLILGGCLTIFLSDVSDMYYKESITDVMTGLFNRRYFFRQSSLLLKSAERHHFPISLIICDIDRFKLINDTYGHDVGDQTIKAFAGIIKQEAREVDLIARHGGEEFIILMPQTDAKGAMVLAERIRKRTEIYSFERIDDLNFSATASFGVAEVDDVSNIETQIINADLALYHAKENGRNRVAVYDPSMVMA